MTEALASGPVAHDHVWQLVSVDNDYGPELKERLCALCAAVTFEA